MSKVQVLFSQNDTNGINNTINTNITNHYYKNAGGIEKRIKRVVSDSDIHRLRPRGKSYIKMWLIQIDKHGL